MTGQEPQRIKPAPKPDDDRDINLDEWDDLVADRYKVPKSLMKAVRSQESGGNVNAVSPTGVRGRYQVTEATAKSYGLDRNDPWQQSVAAAKHLRKMYEETDGADDDEKWLGAVGKYYGGPGAVRNGVLSGGSVDNLSNPARHVESVARKWGEMRKAERGQAQPQQEQPPAQVQPTPAPTSQASRPVTAGVFGQAARQDQQQAKAEARRLLDFRPAGGTQVQIQEEANRLQRQLPQRSPQEQARQEQVRQARLAYREMNPLQQAGTRILAAAGGADPATQQQAYQPTDQVEQAASQFVRGAADTTAAAVRGVGENLPRYAPLSLMTEAATGKSVREHVGPQTARMAQGIKRAGAAVAPVDETDQSWMTSKIPRAAGSMVPFMAASALGGPAGAAGMGVAVNTGQIAEEIDAANKQRAIEGKPPLDPRRQEVATTMAALTGSLEALGIGRALDSVGLKRALIKRGLDVAEEGGQEALTEFLNNVNAKYAGAYDQQRDLSQGVGEAAVLGAIMGGGVQGVGALAGRQAVSPTPLQRPSAVQIGAQSVPRQPQTPLPQPVPRRGAPIQERLRQVGPTEDLAVDPQRIVRSQPTTGQPQQTPMDAPEVFRANADEAKIQAAQFAEAEDYARAAQEYGAAHEALKRLRREVARAKPEGYADQLSALDREISAADANRKAAAAQGRRSLGQAKNQPSQVNKSALVRITNEDQQVQQLAQQRRQKQPILDPIGASIADQPTRDLTAELPSRITQEIPRVRPEDAVLHETAPNVRDTKNAQRLKDEGAGNLQEPTNRITTGGEGLTEQRPRVSRPLDGQPIEVPEQQARRRPPVPAAKPIPPSRTVRQMYPGRPADNRQMIVEGRRVQAEIEAGRGDKGEFGKVAQQMFKSSSGKVLHGQDAFFHDPDVKGAVGLSPDAEMGEVSAAVKKELARIMRVDPEKLSLTQIRPATWATWARQKNLNKTAKAKMRTAIARFQQGKLDADEKAAETAAERQTKQPERERPVRAPQAEDAGDVQQSKVADRLAEVDRMLAMDAISAEDARRMKADIQAEKKAPPPPIKQMRGGKSDVLLERMNAVNSRAGGGGLVGVVELREQMRGEFPTKEAFDKYILEQAEAGRIALYRHDWPASLTAAERDGMVTDGQGNYFIGAAFREPQISQRRSGVPMPERYRASDLFDNAEITYRPARNRAGTVYLNEWGGELMRRVVNDVYGERITDGNFTIAPADARPLIDHLKEIEGDRPQISRAIEQLEQAIAEAERGGQDVAFVTRRAGEPISKTKIKVRHEQTHVYQTRIARALSDLTGGKWLDTQPDAGRIRAELERRGYPSETHDYEAAAFVASGDYGVFGMDEAQAAKFLGDYFRTVVKMRGKDALGRFGAIAPKLQPTLEAARNEAGPKGQATPERRVGADTRDAGRVAPGRDGEGGGSLPGEGRRRIAQMAERPEGRRRDADFKTLRDINLENLREQDEGGEPPQPPRPPRGPRGGGEGGRPPRRPQGPEPPAQQTTGEKIKSNVVGVLSLPRALMASADISAPLRQGAILSLPPSQWGRASKAFIRQLRAFKTSQYEQIAAEIAAHPDAQTARDAGLYFATDKLSMSEEDFFSKFAGKIPLVKHSEQAYKTYLDSLRIDTFSKYKRSIDKSGLSDADAEQAYKAAANWINVATGRGSLGQTFDKVANELGTFFFAPRYVASRINVLNPYTYARNATTPGGRAVLRQQMGDLVQYAGIVSATLALAQAAGASVSLEPDDPDFLKIKRGNTRYDFLAGLQQPMRLFYRLGKDVSGAMMGQKRKGKQDSFDILARFGRSKLAPVPSFFVDAVTGKDFIGQPFKTSRAVIDRVTPLMWRDFYDAYRREGWGGIGKMSPGMLGVGVQDYDRGKAAKKPLPLPRPQPLPSR